MANRLPPPPREFNWARMLRTLSFWALLIVGTIALVQLASSRRREEAEITISQFTEELNAGNIASAKIPEKKAPGAFQRRSSVNRRPAAGVRRMPGGPGKVPAGRRPAAQGRVARGAARDRQDAARQSGRRRGGPAVLLDVGLRLRRDVRRRRCLARARPVRARESARALHHLHRRNRCRRPPPRSRARRRAR